MASALWKMARRDWRHAIWFGSGAAFIMLIGSTPVSFWLAGASERAYASSVETETNADAVVMLGGMIRVSQNDAFSITLGEPADRFVRALEIVRQGRIPALVLGGSSALPGEKIASGTLLEKWARSWRLTEVELLNLGICRNTYDEAIRTRALAAKRGWKKIILVTSALHMTRAEAVFRKQGLDVIPIACDFQSFGVANDTSYSLVPRQDGFDVLERYLHEQIGWIYYKIRGRI